MPGSDRARDGSAARDCTDDKATAVLPASCAATPLAPFPYAAVLRLRTRIGVPRQTNPLPSQLANHRIGRSASRANHTSGDRQDRCQAAM